MDKDQTPDEFMQEILPGSTTFAAKVLCPCCGWHFKHGFTDPTGQHKEPVPGVVVVCGQCLHTLQLNERRELVAMTKEEIEGMDPETRHMVAESWKVAYFALMLTGPEPKGPVQ